MKIMNNFELKRWLSYFLLVLAGIVSYVAVNNFAVITAWFGQFLTYLSPFFAALVIAYLLDIPCSRLERIFQNMSNKFFKTKSRGLSVLIIYTAFVLLLVLLLSILVPELIRNVSEFIISFPAYYEKIKDFLTKLAENDSIMNQFDIEAVKKSLTLSSVLESLHIPSVWQWLLSLLSVSSYFMNFFLAIVSSIYMLLEARSIAAFFSKLLKSFVSEKVAVVVTKYLQNINACFKKYIYCLTIDGTIVGVISVVGLSVIGVKYAVVLGVVEGVTNLIPYFGAIFGTFIVVIVVLLTNGLGQALAVLLFLFILQQIDGNIIKPRLFGDSFDISPFVVILSITIGGSYYGVIGMVIAIPIVAVLKNVLDDILNHRVAKKRTETKELSS